MTLVFGIIGDPIAQARSPLVFNHLFKQRGVDAVMVPMHVAASGVDRAMTGLRELHNLAGLIVTMPHKLAAARLSRPCSERARLAQAVNALRNAPDGWEGDLFDGEGFAVGLETRGFKLAGQNCAIVGAGGAGTAIAITLLERGIASLKLWDADQARAAYLVERLRTISPAHMLLGQPDSHTDIAINATPLGMNVEDPIPMDVSLLPPKAIVADVIMQPATTKLLDEANRRGHEVHGGRHMLDGQVELIWRFFCLPSPMFMSNEAID
jgi:shikimate dehydrogenase